MITVVVACAIAAVFVSVAAIVVASLRFAREVEGADIGGHSRSLLAAAAKLEREAERDASVARHALMNHRLAQAKELRDRARRMQDDERASTGVERVASSKFGSYNPDRQEHW